MLKMKIDPTMCMKTNRRVTNCPVKIRPKVPGWADFCRKNGLAEGTYTLECQIKRSPRFAFRRPPGPSNAHSRDALRRVVGQGAEKLVAAALRRHLELELLKRWRDKPAATLLPMGFSAACGDHSQVFSDPGWIAELQKAGWLEFRV